MQLDIKFVKSKFLYANTYSYCSKTEINLMPIRFRVGMGYVDFKILKLTLNFKQIKPQTKI